MHAPTGLGPTVGHAIPCVDAGGIQFPLAHILVLGVGLFHEIHVRLVAGHQIQPNEQRTGAAGQRARVQQLDLVAAGAGGLGVVVILLGPTDDFAFAEVGSLDEVAELAEPRDVFFVTGEVIHHQHDAKRRVGAVVVEGDAVAHAGVAGRAAVEGPLIRPAAGGALNAQQHIGAAPGGFKILFVTGELVRVEHDPKRLSGVAILHAHKIFAFARPRPVALRPLCLENEIRRALAGLEKFFVAKNLVSPKENHRRRAHVK